MKKKNHFLANHWSLEGRPKSLNEEDGEALIRAVRENRLNSAKGLRDDLELPGQTLHRELLSLELLKNTNGEFLLKQVMDKESVIY